MAKPELEDGFTPIANEILEKLARMPMAPNQWRVLLCIIRKTYGFHKKVDHIANFQIGEATGLCKAVVSRCLKGLSDLELITRKGKLIGFQKDWEKWHELAVPSTLSPKLAEQSTLLDNKSKQNSQPQLAVPSTELAESSTKVSTPAVAQKIKDTLPKDTIQKKVVFLLPEWIDKDTWGAFLEMRRKKRAVPTERAKQLLVKELEKLRVEGNDPNEVLNQSIMRNYTGVFPLKGGQDGARGRRPETRRLPERYRSPDQLYGEQDDA